MLAAYTSPPRAPRRHTHGAVHRPRSLSFRSWAPSPIRKNLSLQQHHPVWWLIIENRAAKARAGAATCLLLDLSHDEVSIVTHELCDPLRPLLAVHLSSTAKGLREAMEEQLAELKVQRQGAVAFAAGARAVRICVMRRGCSWVLTGARPSLACGF